MSQLASSVVSYWKFDASNSNDSVGSNNGTDHTITYSSANGKLNIGAGFNGTASYINMGDVFARFATTGLRVNTNALTYSVWVKQTSAGVNRQIFQARQVAGMGGGVDLFLTTANTFQLRFTSSVDGTQNVFTSSGTLTDTTSFHNIVLVYDGSATASVYLDGVVITGLSGVTRTKTWSLTSAQANLDVGAFGSFASVNFWPGAMDEIGVWSRAVTTTEIQQLWSYNGARQYPFAQNGFSILGI